MKSNKSNWAYQSAGVCVIGACPLLPALRTLNKEVMLISDLAFFTLEDDRL